MASTPPRMADTFGVRLLSVSQYIMSIEFKFSYVF